MTSVSRRYSLLLCLSLSAFASVAHAQEGDLLQNGGFEHSTDGKPDAWQADDLDLAIEEADVHSGQRALRLKTVRTDGHFAALAYQSEQTPVAADTLYLASLWARGSGRLRLGLQQYGKTGWLGGKSAIHTDLTPDWTRYQFYYGTVGADVERVRFDINLDGKDAVGIIDDVALEVIGPREPLGENIVADGDMEADADSDAVPDGWRLGRVLTDTDRRLAVGPDGSRALVCRCSPEPVEPPDYGKWWDWASQPAPAAGWINAASTSVFPVEPGRTYEISFRTRGQDIRVFHTKLWWMKDEKQSTKWFTIGPRHDGSWDWEQVTLSLTIPSAHVHFSRIEFWALAAGGRLWVDDVSIRPSRGYTTGWVEERYEVEPVEVRVELPAVPPPILPAREVRKPAFEARERSEVRVTDDTIAVLLSNGMDLRIALTDGTLLGVGEVNLGNFPLRSPGAPPIAPLIDTESGGHYVSCRYLNHEISDDGTAVLRTALKAADGHEDRLDWAFQPVTRTIAGLDYVGFAYRYEFTSDSESINQIADRSTWELAGIPLGVTVVTQNAYNVENTFTLAPDNVYCGTAGTRLAFGDGLDYQFAPDGALVIFYDEPVTFVDNRRAGSEEYVRYRDTTRYAGERSARTASKCVLFAERGDHDEWTRLRDHVYDKHAAFWDIIQHTPMPLMNCWMHWKELAKHGDQVLYHLADEVAPKLGEMGFKVLALHSVWGRGGCSLDVIEPGEKFGGTEALKYLCEKAAEHGMIVQAWAPTAHMWEHSLLFEQYPGWWIEGPNGEPPTTYCYPEIRGTRFRGGWHDYAIGQWQKIREQTGLGSLWLDSYCSFTHRIKVADPRVGIEQAEDVFRFHAALSQLGYIVYTEATGTFGIVAPGFPVANLDRPNPTGPDPMTRYGVSNYLGHRGNEKQDNAINDVITKGDYYYRCLANKAPCWLSWLVFSQTPERHAKIARANRDYNQVVHLMKYRRTLPDDRGVEWINPDDSTRVLFSFREARYECPGITAAQDITEDKPVEITNGGFTAQAWHTYRITVRQ